MNLVEIGDYVAGNDDEVYKVIKWNGSIYLENGRRCVNAIVELAKWEDVNGGWDQGCLAKIDDE